MDDHQAGVKLSIVIPAYNEEGGIFRTLQTLQASFPGAEIIVVDDGSSDGTFAQAARAHGIKLAKHAFNRGYGAAIKTGMGIATREFIAWFDADCEHRPEDLHKMLDEIQTKSLAAVIGQRSRSSASPVIRIVGKWLIKLMARSLMVKTGPDLNCGLRIFRRNAVIPYLPLLPDGYSASLTTTMIMVERGYPFLFHPVSTGERVGQSKVRLADGFKALVLVIRTIMLFAPLRIFFGSGLFFIAAGLLYGVPFALVYRHGLPVAALLVVLTGVLLCLLGLVADQISQMRLSKHVPAAEFTLINTGAPKNGAD
ncbi:MAG: glycosyltransferase family 2 protein [Nitrospinota bacterium]|nr:glycosyltransferase family 2 protein [Nitrospinota bacterium]